MENLINKWKKIMNNEKTQISNKETINESNTNTNNIQQSNHLSSSLMSIRTDRSNKFKNTSKSLLNRNNSESNLVRSTSSQQKSPQLSNKIVNLNDSDKILQLLNKTVNYIQKNQENSNFQKVLDNINEIIESYIQNLNNNKILDKKYEEKEIIWKTKCDTADRMIKDFELKILTMEKEKTKLKKQIEDLNENLTGIKERNDYLASSHDMLNLLEKNNAILSKTNEQLTDQLNEMKFKHDCLIKKFEDEVHFIRERLDFYKSNLNKVCNTVYEGNFNAY